MIRSICLIGDDLPPLAHECVARGIATHVITVGAGVARELDDGVVVHRVATAADASPSAQGAISRHASNAINFYNALDARVDFDVVICPEVVAGSLSARPTTVVVPLSTSIQLDLDRIDELTNIGSYLRFPPGLRSPRTLRSKLGIVMLAHNALAYTKRAVNSVLHHTDVPLQLVVVDNGSTDSTWQWLESLIDPRVHTVHLSENKGVAGGRNVGLDCLDDDVEFIVLLDNDVELFAGWWLAFTQALDGDQEAGLAGEEGAITVWNETGRQVQPICSPVTTPCDVVAGHCMVVRPEVMRSIGRFDEHLGLFWHDNDDLAMRAARIGVRSLHIASERVLHFEHRSSLTVPGIWATPGVPSELSARNERYLAAKHARQALSGQTPFLLLADAHEAVANPDLFSCYASAFTAVDEVALVLFGVGVEPETYEVELRSAALRFEFDLESGPKVLAICPPTITDEGRSMIADEVHGYLSADPPSGGLSHLAWLPTDRPERLRHLAAMAWRARPRELAFAGATS